jgi:hypothetical protein
LLLEETSAQLLRYNRSWGRTKATHRLQAGFAETVLQCTGCNRNTRYPHNRHSLLYNIPPTGLGRYPDMDIARTSLMNSLSPNGSGLTQLEALSSLPLSVAVLAILDL